MKRNKLKNRQKTYLSTRMRIVIGASIFTAASLLLIVVFNLSEVKESRAFSSGDFRTAANGDWNDIASWEVYDGKDWSEASMPPGHGTNTVLVTNGHALILSEELAISNIIIDEGAKLTIDANTIRVAKGNGKGGIVCNGTLSMGMSIIEGDGDLIIGSKATLLIGSEAGIDKKGESGNIQLKGKKEFNKDALYIYNGTVHQQTGNALPAVLRNLVIENASGVEMDQSLLIVDKLHLKKGVLFTGRFTVSIGASIAAPGEIERTTGAVCGKIKRWFGPLNVKNISFPVSDAETVNIFSFTSDLPQYQKGMIDVMFHEGSLEKANQNPFEARHVIIGISEKGYYTAYLSNGPEEALLKITATLTGNNNENKISWKIDTNKKKILSAAENANARIENIQNIITGPNPFKDTFFVRFLSDEAAIANVQLMNAAGQIVYNEKMDVVEGYNQFEYSSKQELSPGTYVLQISNHHEIHTMKLIRDK